MPGYDLAALAIFAVPWGLGSVIGLSCRVIDTLPIFPTYPNPLTIAEVGAGFVMPYTLAALIGTGGSVGMLFLLFMAVTSTMSSSMIAVSSIISFDMYRTYINPKATDKQVVRVSHLGVVGHGIFITGFALMLNYGGANMSWINYFAPVLTCPGILPLILTLTWSGQSRKAAIISPILGLCTGITIWLSTTKSIYGSISITTTGMEAPCLYGTLGSFFSPLLYSLIISAIDREVFDWREFLRIDLVQDKTPLSTTNPSATGSIEDISPVGLASSSDDEHSAEKGGEKIVSTTVIAERTPASLVSLDDLTHPFARDLPYLKRWLHIAVGFLVFIIALTFVAWPLPLYRDYIFTKSFFSAWVAVAIFWQFFALFAVVVYPVYDGRREVAKSVRGLLKLTKKD